MNAFKINTFIKTTYKDNENYFLFIDNVVDNYYLNMIFLYCDDASNTFYNLGQDIGCAINEAKGFYTEVIDEKELEICKNKLNTIIKLEIFK